MSLTNEKTWDYCVQALKKATWPAKEVVACVNWKWAWLP